jgi:hypothetical protein
MVRRRYYTIEWSPTRQGKNATTVAVAAAASSLLLLHITHTVEELLDTPTPSFLFDVSILLSVAALDIYIFCLFLVFLLKQTSVSGHDDVMQLGHRPYFSPFVISFLSFLVIYSPKTQSDAEH